MILAVTSEDVLLNYGPLGVGVLVLGWFAWFMLRRLFKEIDELRAQRDDMVQTLFKIVPLMERSTAIHEKRQLADEQNRRVLDSVVETLKDVQRELGAR